MSDGLRLLVLFVVYIVVMKWLLPRLGVST